LHISVRLKRAGNREELHRIKLRDNSNQRTLPRAIPAPRAADALLLQPQIFVRHDAPHGAIGKITSRRAEWSAVLTDQIHDKLMKVMEPRALNAGRRETAARPRLAAE
jgi:hypothetical protein